MVERGAAKIREGGCPKTYGTPGEKSRPLIHLVAPAGGRGSP